MKTLSYIYGREEEIEVGEEYYFGQLWDGDDEEAEEFVICDFEIVENNNDEMKTIVKVTSIG